MINHVGEQLGNYRLIQLLAVGSSSQVYLGKHVYLNTPAAVKLFSNRLEDQNIEQFYKEARTVARLEHDNIARFLEFGMKGNAPFLVMEYAPNGSLRQRHPRGSRLPLSIIITYVEQIADALQYIHDEGMIHRAIRPENLLLGERKEVLLSDFYLATLAQDISNSDPQVMFGNPGAYTAPEQLRGRASVASDQYVLGIVVYEWLCGDTPFGGTIFKIESMNSLPRPLHEKIPIPLLVEDVVLKALAKTPEQRFPSVQGFAEALERAIKLPSE